MENEFDESGCLFIRDMSARYSFVFFSFIDLDEMSTFVDRLLRQYGKAWIVD